MAFIGVVAKYNKLSVVYILLKHTCNVCKLYQVAGSCLLKIQVLTVLTPDICILIRATQAYMA